MTVRDHLAPLWWHLFEKHFMDAGKIHGDPELMHGACHAFNLSTDGHDHADYPKDDLR